MTYDHARAGMLISCHISPSIIRDNGNTRNAFWDNNTCCVSPLGPIKLFFREFEGFSKVCLGDINTF